MVEKIEIITQYKMYSLLASKTSHQTVRTSVIVVPSLGPYVIWNFSICRKQEEEGFDRAVGEEGI